MSSAPRSPGKLLAGRYAMFEPIASGGMATVHYGRLLGPVGFARTVAIKRLHPSLASDPEFVAIFMDEARLAARVRHPNVVSVLDVVAEGGELLLVMEYVHGETLSRLIRAARRRHQLIPLPVASAIVSGMLHGLHAAHEATSESGEPLGVVHRDVSPQNVLVGADGAPHLVDFGIAKAVGRAQTTREGQLKGKLPYMALEQLRGREVTRRTDVYAASAVLWEALTGERLYQGDDAVVFGAVIEGRPRRPSELVSGISPELEALVMRGLSSDPEQRFATAREMALALERVLRPATSSEVGAWVESVAADALGDRARRLAEIESRADGDASQPSAVSARTTFGTSTQVSSISVSRPSAERRSKRSRTLGALIALLLTLVAAVIVAALSSGPKPMPMIATRLALAPAASALKTEPAATASASAAAKPLRAPQRQRPTKRPTQARCRYLGPDGIYHIRPECL